MKSYINTNYNDIQITKGVSKTNSIVEADETLKSLPEYPEFGELTSDYDERRSNDDGGSYFVENRNQNELPELVHSN